MQYLRDCKNTKDFEEHFLKPFVNNEINNFKYKLLDDFEKEFWCESKEFKFIMKYNLLTNLK